MIPEFKPESSMVGTMTGPALHIQYKGAWDANGLYSMIFTWFEKQKYKVYEKQHRSRKPGPFGTEQLQVIEGQREMDEYHLWEVSVRIETFDEHEVEAVDKNGEKKKMSKGKLWVTVTGSCTTDYEGKWEGNMFTLYLRRFYNQYVMRKRIEALMLDPMYYGGMQNLHSAIRHFLDLETKEWSHKYAAGLH